MPSDGSNRNLDDKAEADGQPGLPAFEQARQDAEQVVSWSTNHTPPAETISFAPKASDLFDPTTAETRRARFSSGVG